MIVTMLATTGCGKMTPEKIINKTLESINEEKSYDMNAKVELLLNVVPNDIRSGIEINGEVDVTVNKDDEKNSKTRMEGDAYIRFLKEEKNSMILGYVEQEDGVFVSYKTDEASGRWMRGDDEGINVNMLLDLFAKNEEILMVKENTEEVDGQECYVLTFKLKGEDIKSMLEMLGASKRYSLISRMQFPETEFLLYINKKTMLPVQIAANGLFTGEESKNHFQALVKFNNWDEAREVVIPEVAKRAKGNDRNTLFEGGSLESESK